MNADERTETLLELQHQLRAIRAELAREKENILAVVGRCERAEADLVSMTTQCGETRKLLKAAVDGFDSAMAMLKQDAAAKARLEAEVLRLMTELEETRAKECWCQ